MDEDEESTTYLGYKGYSIKKNLLVWKNKDY